MTETEIRAYLINAYNAGVERARQEYRDHPTSGACYGGHPCRHLLLRNAKRAEAAQQHRDQENP